MRKILFCCLGFVAAFLFGIPDGVYRLFLADQNTWGFFFFGFAQSACVLDFLAVLLRNRRHGLVFQVHHYCLQFQCALWTVVDAFAAAIAFQSVYNDVEFS